VKITARHGSNAVRYCVAAALGTALVAAPAMADEDTLEEITVTAQKREQNVQNVPIAITAITADTLQSKSLGDIGSLTRLAPNVNLDVGSPFSGDSSVLSASIRGIGQDDFAFNLDPGVGVYVDGVYLARTIGANQSLLDVDRIEILKGPQGTLFGRNTIGGAISIVTHQPGEEKRFVAQATTGSFNRRDIALTADFPLASNFLTTVSFSSQVRDGYQDVIPFPTDSELGQVPWVVDPQTAFPKAGYGTADTKGGQNLQVFRGKALWKALWPVLLGGALAMALWRWGRSMPGAAPGSSIFTDLPGRCRASATTRCSPRRRATISGVSAARSCSSATARQGTRSRSSTSRPFTRAATART